MFGLIGGWIIVALILAMVYEVISRYFLNAPTKWAFEMAYMLMGTSFMFGMAWCLQMRRHIRVDFVYDHVSPRHRAIIDVVGFLLLLPMLLWLCAGLWDYFHQAYRVDEESGESAWNPIIWPFKYTFVMGFVLAADAVGGGDHQVRHGALRPGGPRARAGGGPLVSVELALWMFPALMLLIFLGFPVAFSLLVVGLRVRRGPLRLLAPRGQRVRAEDRRGRVRLRTRGGAALHLHGLAARTLRHRGTAVRGDPPLDPAAPRRPRGRHRDSCASSSRRRAEGGRGDRVGGGVCSPSR